MKNFPALIPAVALLALATVAAFSPAAQAQGLTSEQVLKIKERLSQLQETIASATLEKNTSVSDIFLKASSSDKTARDFYLDTIRTINFDRYDRSGTEYRDWERNNENRLDDDEFIQALRIQLRYLAISSEAATTDDLADVLPRLLEFIDGLSTLDEPPHRMLNSPVSDSIFAERYDLQDSLKKREKTWEMEPTRVSGMYDKTILPYLRLENPSQIMAAWDRRLRQEAGFATIRGEDAEVRFSRETLPSLQWGRLKDMFVYNNRVQAAADMLAHLERNLGPPLHPKTQEWLGEFMGLMEMKAPSATDAPATDTPAPESVPEPNPLGLETPETPPGQEEQLTP
jgi:hypothetical protein